MIVWFTMDLLTSLAVMCYDFFCYYSKIKGIDFEKNKNISFYYYGMDGWSR